MAKLTNVSQKIHRTMSISLPHSGRLLGLAHDDSFILMNVSVRDGPERGVGELRIYINNCLDFAWPTRDLVARYRKFSRVAGNPDDLEQAVMALSELARTRIRRAMSSSSTSELVEQGPKISATLESLAAATTKLNAGTGVQLERSILIPPRGNVEIRDTKGAKLKVYLGGLHSMPL